MARLLLRLHNAWRRHGFIGFVRLSAYNLVYYAAARFRRRGPTRDLFDERYGTETAGIHEVGSLDISSKNARVAVRYQPSAEKSVRALIDRLDVDLSDFTFIDFGSGKGRVLLIAAAYPFKEVIGVEFSPQLNAIAVRNLGHLPSEALQGERVRSICIDATEFDLPHSNLVCYFYNPFGTPVMARVAERLTAHHEQRGFQVIVIYLDPRELDLFKRSGTFTMQIELPNAVILATKTRNKSEQLLAMPGKADDQVSL